MSYIDEFENAVPLAIIKGFFTATHTAAIKLVLPYEIYFHTIQLSLIFTIHVPPHGHRISAAYR